MIIAAMPKQPMGPDMNLSQPNYWPACPGYFETNIRLAFIDNKLVIAVSALL